MNRNNLSLGPGGIYWPTSVRVPPNPAYQCHPYAVHAGLTVTRGFKCGFLIIFFRFFLFWFVCGFFLSIFSFSSSAILDHHRLYPLLVRLLFFCLLFFFFIIIICVFLPFFFIFLSFSPCFFSSVSCLSASFDLFYRMGGDRNDKMYDCFSFSFFYFFFFDRYVANAWVFERPFDSRRSLQRLEQQLKWVFYFIFWVSCLLPYYIAFAPDRWGFFGFF